MADTREQPNLVEVDLLKTLSSASDERLLYVQKETAEFLGHLATDELRSASERVVSMYFMATNSVYGCSHGFSVRAVEPFAKALLESLLNHSDQEAAEAIAYRTVKGAAVASAYKNIHLKHVGMAALCTFPRHLGQCDLSEEGQGGD